MTAVKLPPYLHEALIRLSVRTRERDPEGRAALETIQRYVVETETTKQAMREAMNEGMKEKMRAFNDLAPHVVFIPSLTDEESK